MRYSVIRKKATLVIEIVQVIKEKFYGQTGIIYCLSKNECDEIAQLLDTNGIKSKSYHAGLTHQVRLESQTKWINGDVQVNSIKVNPFQLKLML